MSAAAVSIDRVSGSPRTERMPPPPTEIVNFGGNVRFRPQCFYEPRTEEEVLELLRRHARGQIRVAAARHSWSELIVAEDAVVSLKHFTTIETRGDDDGQT